MVITECPRDAMQGLHDFIPTETKIAYQNELLKVGFDVLDCGSFVSPKAIPQMKDTAEVLDGLEIGDSSTELLVIIANERGANDAARQEKVSYLGFPFSVSETFQQRNTNSGISEAFDRVRSIVEICQKADKKPLVYLSMAFGNPYGDDWSAQMVLDWAGKMAELGVKNIALADTIGCAEPAIIQDLFSVLIPGLPEVEVGAHLHTTPTNWQANVEAALEAGCQRFDSAIYGLGGCPMAKDDLTGNLATENLLRKLGEKNVSTSIDQDAFAKAMMEANKVFQNYM